MSIEIENELKEEMGRIDRRIAGVTRWYKQEITHLRMAKKSLEKSLSLVQKVNTKGPALNASDNGHSE